MREALARPEAFPAPRPARVDVVETHISCVFLGKRDVFKVKKPVDLGFLDFRTIERRKKACDAEVTLNRRLAPGVYLGVVPVMCGRDGRLTFGGRGTIVDWAVHMRRLADARRADYLLLDGQLSTEIVDALADRIAAFHASAKCDAETAALGSVEAIERNVVENFAQTRATIAAHLSPDEADEIEVWQRGFLRAHAASFEERVASGKIREGHGDLRLEHVYVDRSRAITVIDCIEFNERFRYADVCADVAFLAMDLAWHGRADLAERFLARYALVSGDYDLYALVDFYESYRAYVRGKVATMLAADPSASPEARSRAATQARRYFLLALAAHRRSLMPPMLVCVGGVIASGKSTVADAIGRELGAPVLEADRTRKQMLGLQPDRRVNDDAWKGAYDPAFTEAVYREVFRRASVVLASGRPAVIDASFRSAAERRIARDLARTHGLAIRFVECKASADVCRARLRDRAKRAAVSDGRLSIFDDFCARFEPFVELAPAEHFVVDSSRPVDVTMASVRAHLKTWPRGLVA